MWSVPPINSALADKTGAVRGYIYSTMNHTKGATGNTKKLPGTRAYVLIDADPEMAPKVVQTLRGRGDIALVDMINGPYSAIAVVEGKEPSTVAAAILGGIRKLSAVRDITVYMAVSEREIAAPVDGA